MLSRIQVEADHVRGLGFEVWRARLHIAIEPMRLHTGAGSRRLHMVVMDLQHHAPASACSNACCRPAGVAASWPECALPALESAPTAFVPCGPIASRRADLRRSAAASD